MKHLRKIFESEQKGLSLPELSEKGLKGQIKIDTCGHIATDWNDRNQFDSYFDDLKKAIDRKNEFQEEQIKKDPTKKELYQKINSIFVETLFEPGQMVNAFLASLPEPQCDGCGERLRAVIKSNNEIAFVGMSTFFDIDKDRDNTIKLDEIPNCEFAKLDVKDRIETKIEVPTGNLVFANFFRQKEIYSPGDFEINSLLGRIQLAKHLADLNVGYGQMGNMSVDVWKRTDGKQIIIGDGEYFENSEYYQVHQNEFIYLGNICLDVWRWMCADKSVLEKHGEKLPKLKVDKCVDLEYRDFILAKVESGTWVIHHYYDLLSGSEENNGVYSVLNKI
jgi:hypothetical protein